MESNIAPISNLPHHWATGELRTRVSFLLVLTPLDLASEFSDFNTEGMFSQGFTGSVAQIGVFAAQEYGFDFLANNPFALTARLKKT